jgi:hypothetical protein
MHPFIGYSKLRRRVSAFSPAIVSTPYTHVHSSSAAQQNLSLTTTEPTVNAGSMQYSHRHNGLYLYIGRLVRPVWNLKIVTRANVDKVQFVSIFFFNPMPPHVRHGLRGLPPGRGWTSEVGTPMRRSYVVWIRWMDIYGYEVPGGALNLNCTNYPDRGHHGDPPLSGKNPRGRAGNRTLDLMISSQKRWTWGWLVCKYGRC